MPPTIRHAKPQDLAAIVAIYNSTINSRQVTADLHPVSIAERETWFHTHFNDAQRPIFVLESAMQEVLAWGSFSDYYTRPAYHISVEISLYVHESMRGQGIGQILLAEMLERAPALGIRNVVGVIFGHNQASIALFQSMGFVEWGRLPEMCELDGQLADVVLLGKKING